MLVAQKSAPQHHNYELKEVSLVRECNAESPAGT